MYTRAVLLALLLTACAPTPAAPAGPEPAKLRLCVVNRTASSGQATVRTEMQAWRVMPGETACKVVPWAVGGIRLSATSIGGGIGGALRWSEVWTPGGTACWRLTLYDTATAITLVPCDFHRGGAPAATEVQDGGLTTIRVHPRWRGLTFCPEGGERASAWINLDAIADEDWTGTIAHELAHVATIERDGGCTAHKALLAADPMGVALRVEAEGFCASARTYARQWGVPLESAIWRYAGWLERYQFGLSRAQAAQEIARRCPAA